MEFNKFLTEFCNNCYINSFCVITDIRLDKKSYENLYLKILQYNVYDAEINESQIANTFKIGCGHGYVTIHKGE